MEILVSPESLTSLVATQRRDGRSIGFVPTMGALHAGHLSLIDIARSRCDFVIVSAFVNPLQFENRSDFEGYPQTQDADERMCSNRGVDVLYRPTPEAMYPAGFSTSIHVSCLSDVYEGASRPGHFDGVATVVAKLLTASHPDVAVFGAKDFQQVAVVRRMVADLGLDVEIIAAPIVRESDGLAMSSRNVRLGSKARRSASALSRSLRAAQNAFLSGTTRSDELVALVTNHASMSPLVVVDYVAVVDPYTLSPVVESGPDDVVLIAAIVDGVRLIDNVVLGNVLDIVN